MIAMLGEKDFEHITITELCRAAEISRITFYSHYSDKYALLDEIFDDMLKLGTEDYYRRQRENNPTGRLAAGYVNMLDAILQLYSYRFDFFRHTDPEKNPYLASRLYSIVLGDGGAAYAACEKADAAQSIRRERSPALYVSGCLDSSMSPGKKIRRWMSCFLRRGFCSQI